MISEKLKFSIKVSLSITLAFLIPFSQGWEQAQIAAITIMLIATIGSLNDSILKGALRVLGTIIGAIIGLSLIAIFPQDRFIYLFFLSIFVSIFLYLVRAYKGDPSMFMLSAMTMMMVFDNGAVDDVFLFGLDKIYMSILGITIYTLVNIFIWPTSATNNSSTHSLELLNLQKELFSKRNIDIHEYSKLYRDLLNLEKTLIDSTTELDASSLDSKQLHNINQSYKKISEYLALEMNHKSDYTKHNEDIMLLLEDITTAYETKEQIVIPNALDIDYNSAIQKDDISHIQKASLISEMKNVENIFNALRELALKLNALHSLKPTLFTAEDIPTQSNFIFGNIEHIKATVVSFLIFWFATFFWIYFNPPAGFMIVTLATGLSVLTSFTPLRPSILLTVFSFSFVFASLIYVFVLPNLHYAWELALLIFFYSFISFYFLPAKIVVLFLIGLFTFGLGNEMNYNFSLFLLILLVFYLFLFILQIFAYLPFSTKAEHLFSSLHKRFFRFSSSLYETTHNVMLDKSSWYLKLTSYYAQKHFLHTLENMHLWLHKVDTNYFTSLDEEKINLFSEETEKFAYLLNLLYYQNTKMKHNSLVVALREEGKIPHYSMQNTPKSSDIIEDKLVSILNSISFDKHHKDDIIDFYENINLRKNVWNSFFRSKEIINETDLQTLKITRF